MEIITTYAVRQSSKGYSNIIAVCDTRELAEYVCKAYYENDARENAKSAANGRHTFIKCNYRIEEIARYRFA